MKKWQNAMLVERIEINDQDTNCLCAFMWIAFDDKQGKT